MSVTPEILSYPDKGHQQWSRLESVRALFCSKYGREPDIFVRVPGRVNLIGEHVDYCGYSVCPMAVEQNIVFAAAITPEGSPFLKLVNDQAKVYPDTTVPDRKFEIDLKRDGWAAYVLCGVKGIAEILVGKSLVNMEIAVSGTVPPGSGLSSSSALVCASLLTTAQLNNVKLTKFAMAEMSASCERFIGMEGGGMDQAIAFLATRGCAKHIQFNPVRTEDVKLPSNAVFVIGHSLVTKRKAETSEYNTRVAECRLASQIIAKESGIDWEQIKKVKDLQDALSCNLEELLNLVDKHLHAGVYTKQEVCQCLGIGENELNEISLSPSTRKIKEFVLKERVTHVTSIEGLGVLMTASHNSMAKDYDASDPACDRLVNSFMTAGALGARVTGAGWGGCVVALTTPDRLNQLMDHVRLDFYAGYEGDVGKVLFQSEPQSGACVIKA
ncbi:unnamed protein product [Nesidiocoris tenuis]|uniref:Galactokinase n=1 Tax=Nesidiocoris tenuis TaxID=355587 RepID=A0A6H5GYB9_9HEMI|nr:unnamed protein product [Nesidiocoris tenuis]